MTEGPNLSTAGNLSGPSRKRPLDAILFAVLVILLFLSAFQKQRWDSDIFWALKSGQWIVENLNVPSTDPFSYTFAGSPWVDFTWGFQVLAHVFYTRLGGWYGLSLLQLIVTLLTFFFIYRNLKLFTGKRFYLTIVLLYLVLAISAGRFFIRPHLFSYLFVSVYMFLLNLYQRDSRLRYVLPLIPLQVLWVNIHSSFILGLFIAAAYALSRFVSEARENGLRAHVSRQMWVLFAAAILLAAASFINPYGLRLVIFPFIHQTGENVEALRHIAEWTNAGLKELMFYLYPLPIHSFAFKIVLFGGAALVVLNIRRVALKDLLLLVVPFYMAARHNRFVVLFAFFSVPVLAELLSAHLMREGGNEGGNVVKGERNLRLISTLASVFIASLMAGDFALARKSDDYGAGIKKGAYPEGTVSFMRREGLKGNIYNEYVFGGYLIYNDIKVFIDGRTPTVYSPYFFWTTLVGETDGRWERLVEEYGINIALVKTEGDFCRKLRDDKGWIPVVFDDVSVLYLKKGGVLDGIISRHGLKNANPCEKDPKYELPVDRERLKEVREELKTVVDYYASAGLSERISRPHRLLGLADTALGGDYLNEAEEELKKASAIDESPFTLYDLGLALGKLKKYDSALSAFKSAKRGFPKGYMGMGITYYDMKDYENSVRYLERYVDIVGIKGEALAHETLGLACFKSARFDCAIRNLKKAAFLTGDGKELANIYYHIASSLLEKGDPREAGIFYAKSIEKDPQYARVLSALLKDFEKRGRLNEVRAISEAIGQRM